jgi:hypothetical protein
VYSRITNLPFPIQFFGGAASEKPELSMHCAAAPPKNKKNDILGVVSYTQATPE